MESWRSRWRSVFQLFGLRSWLVAAIGGIVTLVLIGIPTAIIDNPFFFRMTPVRTQDYFIWVATGLLTGLIAGTFTLSAKASASGKVVSGGFLSVLAVSCPICNKLVLYCWVPPGRSLTSGRPSFTSGSPLWLYLAGRCICGCRPSIGVAALLLNRWKPQKRIQRNNGLQRLRIPTLDKSGIMPSAQMVE